MASATRTIIFLMWVTFGISTLVYAVYATGYNRMLMFKEPVDGKILPGHVIKTEKVANEGSCRVKCFMEPKCVSINVGPDEHGGRMCELKNFTDESSSKSGLEEKKGYIHYAVENFCHSDPCPGENFLCQVGFTDKGYRCVCRDGFKGDNCEDTITSKAPVTPTTTSETQLVPDAVAFFPLNSTFGTKEIKNRVAEGDASGVTFAPGPERVAGGSYKFSGSPNSFIKFPNSEGAPLDVRHSMTMLCWVYYEGKNGPLFDYRATGKAGVHLWVNDGKLYVYFRSRGYLDTLHLWHTVLAGGWKFVGASYDHSTGDANLWVNGAVVYTRNIGIGLDLATNDSIRMGAYDRAYFKGRIAQMQVYDKALTQEQIQAIQQQTEVVVALSCSHLKKEDPTAASGNYNIDPDGEGVLEPFSVYCDMTNENGVGVTVISHDSESKTFVNRYEDEGSYTRDINYTRASLSQLASLTIVSLHCEQFIKYECCHSRFRFNADPYGWWVSRDSTKMTYWGGASPGSGKCACGMNNTCANPNKGCNCDANDNVWREDSGLLTDKTKLPVKQLRFGDTGGSNEKGYHTLGKFKCYGIA